MARRRRASRSSSSCSRAGRSRCLGWSREPTRCLPPGFWGARRAMRLRMWSPARLPGRPYGRHLAAHLGAGAGVLRRTSKRPPRGSQGPLHQQVSRCVERAAVPVRSWSELWTVHVVQSARDQRANTEKDTVVVRVDVLNEGASAAEETVFLFTHQKLAPVTRPLLELKGFAKIRLKPGQTGTVTLFLAATELRFPGRICGPSSSPGRWRFSSDRARIVRDCSRGRFFSAAHRL